MAQEYERKSNVNTAEFISSINIPYGFFKWSEHLNHFQYRDYRFAESHSQYDWQTLDQVCSGQHDEIEDQLKARKMSFVILPRSCIQPISKASKDSHTNYSISGIITQLENESKADNNTLLSHSLEDNQPSLQHEKELSKDFENPSLTAPTDAAQTDASKLFVDNFCKWFLAISKQEHTVNQIQIFFMM
ncbi:hypothetical protein RFI_24746 [Reticulomyxa filosa]|uniref:Uncharacterized protein n=1 Tax=Reticulomyxa filosa TaxID=46433 RepID=X6MHT5_RETFI|nr:hypothetical protein RFI_24746 [Reticulomyxa filosa]|eukprot:ETO12630.1 hypothetical protein RFI_24746 [Reticulomyxa filosa]